MQLNTLFEPFLVSLLINLILDCRGKENVFVKLNAFWFLRTIFGNPAFIVKAAEVLQFCFRSRRVDISSERAGQQGAEERVSPAHMYTFTFRFIRG